MVRAIQVTTETHTHPTAMSATRIGLALVCAQLLSWSSAAPPSLELRQYPGGQAVSQRQLPEAICRGWVEVRTSSRAPVVFWDILLEVEENSRVLLGCNQDFIYALVLAGRFDNGIQKLTAGMASLWSHFGGGGDSPAIYDFSARTLAQLFSEAGQPNDTDLEDLMRAQESLRDGSNRNVAKTLMPAAAGQSFRVFPEVMAIKRASRHRTDYGLRTATQFATALTQRDTGLLAALLAPSLIDDSTSTTSPSTKPSPARMAFAERLLALSDYSPLENSPDLRDLGNLQYEMSSSGQALRITLQEAEGCFYVKRLDPRS